jgi:hypothetical protein
MHIFIDESGTFQPVEGGHSLSLVGALVIPEGTFSKVAEKYKRLRQNLPTRKGEVKGSLLNEKQVSQVLDVLFRNGVLFDASVIDMGMHTAEELQAHRTIQAQKLVENLTEKHHPNLVAQMNAYKRQLEEMPLQLYVQSTVLYDLIHTTITYSTLYQCQRNPRELRNFHWVVDAKDKRVTKTEEWWRTFMAAMLESKSRREPLAFFEEGDYSFFKRFDTKPSEFHSETYGLDPNRTVTDIKMLMTESFRFSADVEPGLELADIVTNVARRALNGNLGFEGWTRLPEMMVGRKDQSIRLIALHDREVKQRLPYQKEIMRFKGVGRDLLAPRFRQSV